MINIGNYEDSLLIHFQVIFQTFQSRRNLSLEFLNQHNFYLKLRNKYCQNHNYMYMLKQQRRKINLCGANKAMKKQI